MARYERRSPAQRRRPPNARRAPRGQDGARPDGALEAGHRSGGHEAGHRGPPRSRRSPTTRARRRGATSRPTRRADRAGYPARRSMISVPRHSTASRTSRSATRTATSPQPGQRSTTPRRGRRGARRARGASPQLAGAQRRSSPRRRAPRPSRPATPLPSVCSSSSSHPPVGPKRSAWMRRGSWPASTSRSATRSTNGVGPQTKQRARPRRRPTPASIAASTRRASRVQPGGARACTCSRRAGPSRGSSRVELVAVEHVVGARAPRPAGAPRRRCPRAARWRSIAISGTSPEPPATSSSGPPSSTAHVKCPPIGPRTSNSSPGGRSSTSYGETSPSSMSSTVSSSASTSGAEAIEYERSAW